MSIQEVDYSLINFARRISMPLARIAIFVIYFWFGALKVLGFSPASALVKDLLAHTLSFMQPETFLILFGIFEMLIGVLFIIRGLERVVMPLLIVHLFTTVLPLFFLAGETWSGFLVPTMEGQYIIKNLAIIAAAIAIAARLTPMKNHDSK